MYETRSEQWKKHWRPSLFPSWVCQIETNFTSLCKINKIPIIIPMYFFLIGLKYPEIHLERIRYLWLAIKCRKKCAKGTFGLPDVRGHYKATVIKSTWYQHRLRQMNQCNRLESPGIDIWLWKYTATYWSSLLNAVRLFSSFHCNKQCCHTHISWCPYTKFL